MLPSVYGTLFSLLYGINLWSVGHFRSIVFPVFWSISSTHSFVHLFIYPGILNLPAVALGIITGGFVLKRFKLGVIGAARVSIAASWGSLCMFSIQAFIHCDNAEVGGLTVSYQGWVACLHFWMKQEVSEWASALQSFQSLSLSRKCWIQTTSKHEQHMTHTC